MTVYFLSSVWYLKDQILGEDAQGEKCIIPRETRVQIVDEGKKKEKDRYVVVQTYNMEKATTSVKKLRRRPH